ncbi:M20 aminoacylase family protein [Rhodoferax mekongensis]|uniref:M20 aminoacylase family protein n=1 Tax=Rhodoferax mekongensis TaxID=3068341 RepID=UPI0028BF0B75|nr:M20 aminoacylase family protein [Rhodoferax sp. TBRC 17199]MDT7515838.1 M20 aminoacylase family protein [Rhodoferax sp. TBRC 17199]
MSTVLDALQSSAITFTALRRDLHQHPEIGFQEFRTSDIVAQRLRDWGYEVTLGLGGTGVVGQLRKGSGTRRLGLRADMDALPIQEATGLPHASCHEGLMHACGHDGHTAMLLAAAEYLASKGNFQGTLNLIFQPAEESLGGARKMMEDGLFERFPCDAVFAMHNMPGFPQGQLLLREGATMASSENILVHIEGKGSHGAMPHLGADPVVAGASIVMALQTIVSRNVPPLQTAVVTVGAFQSGVANNVIPQTATLKLSVRALDRGVRLLLRERIVDLVEAQAKSFGVTARVEFLPGYPVLVNTAAETALAREVAIDLVGPANVVQQTEPLTGSEDFAYMLEKVPGSYLFIGNGDASTGGHGACMVHNPNYDFEDRNIPIGAAYWVHLAERFLA